MKETCYIRRHKEGGERMALVAASGGAICFMIQFRLSSDSDCWKEKQQLLLTLFSLTVLCCAYSPCDVSL